MSRASPHKKSVLKLVYFSVPGRFVAFVVVVVLLFLPLAPMYASEEIVEAAIPAASVDPPPQEPPEAPPPEPEAPQKSDAETQVALEDIVVPDETVSDVTLSPIEVVGEEILESVPSNPSPETETSADDTDIAPTEESIEHDTSSATATLPVQNVLGDATTTEGTSGQYMAPPATSTATSSESSSPLPETKTASTSPAAADVVIDNTIPTVAVTPESSVAIEPNDLPTSTTEDTQASTTETATSTDETYDVIQPLVLSVVNNRDNKYQFSDTECVSVGDGSFYCSKAVEEQAVSLRADGIIAAPDQDGDNEIYIIKDGIETQITKNVSEDLAPHYDAKSNRIVWHRLVNDRYQILSYGVNTREETILTDTPYNNMEPTAYGSITVWQSWIGSGWEIMILDGEELMQLTDNTVPDVAPFVNEDYIVWQTQIGDSWYMSLYDRDTGEIERIENSDGASIENPRFVLVYDAHLENGDVQTLGYDLETKEVVPLSSAPAPLPEKIPEPDPTEEQRALIQGKPPTEDDIIIVSSDGGGGPPTGSTTPSTSVGSPMSAVGTSTSTESAAVASTTDASTIVIPALEDNTPVPAEEDVATSTDPIVQQDAIEPVIVEPLPDTATSTSTDHIEDVVIPQLTEEVIE